MLQQTLLRTAEASAVNYPLPHHPQHLWSYFVRRCILLQYPQVQYVITHASSCILCVAVAALFKRAHGDRSLSRYLEHDVSRLLTEQNLWLPGVSTNEPTMAKSVRRSKARLMTINSICLAQWYHHPSEAKPDKAKARHITPSQQVGIRVSTNGAKPSRASVCMMSATRLRPAPPKKKTWRRTNRPTVRTHYRDVSTPLSVQYVRVRSRRREKSVRWLPSAAGESQRPSTMLPPKRLKSGFNQARLPSCCRVCVSSICAPFGSP